jgi:hypothetical protein
MLSTVERIISSVSYIIHYLLLSDALDTLFAPRRFVWPGILAVLVTGGLGDEGAEPSAMIFGKPR